MPRPRRLKMVGIPQHITQRVNNRQACFLSTHLSDGLMDRAAQRRDCCIHAQKLIGSDPFIGEERPDYRRVR